jgi:hypothetical protein
VVSDSSTGRTTVTFVTDSVPANSATRLVRFAPARFRLQPGGSQVVRFVAVTPDDLPEGEYWGRLTVAAAAVSEDGAGEATVRVSGSVNIEVQTVIPLFFRKGRLATALRGTVTSASREGNVVRVQPHFERSGNGVSIGLAKIDVLDAANAVVHTLSRQLAVYNRLDPLYELELPEALAGRAARVRLMIFDVDGVLTDGRLLVGPEGEISKAFDTLDGHGIKLLAQAGITSAIITGRQSEIVAWRAGELGIEHLYQGVADKREAFAHLLAAAELQP